MKDPDERSIRHMEDYDVRMLKSRSVIDTVGQHDIPIIFIQEIHREYLQTGAVRSIDAVIAAIPNESAVSA